MRLWQDSICNAFQPQQNPQVLHYWASRLRDLRNRVAHAESLLEIDVRSYHRTVVRILRVIDSQVADWYTANTKVIEVFKQRPAWETSRRRWPV
jgi:hypothetical protein